MPTCSDCPHFHKCNKEEHAGIEYPSPECPAHTRERELLKVLRALVNKIDAVHNHSEYRYIWELAFSHGHKYAGPQYVKELDAARELLEPK